MNEQQSVRMFDPETNQFWNMQPDKVEAAKALGLQLADTVAPPPQAAPKYKVRNRQTGQDEWLTAEQFQQRTGIDPSYRQNTAAQIPALAAMAATEMAAPAVGIATATIPGAARMIAPIVRAGAAGLGGAAGQAAVDIPESLTAEQRAQRAAETGLTQAALQGAVEWAQPAFGAAAKKVYGSYIKPYVESAKDAAKQVKSLLENELSLSAEGVSEGKKLIAQARQEIDAFVAQQHGVASLTDIANHVREWANAKYGGHGGSETARAAANKVADEILKNVDPNVPFSDIVPWSDIHGTKRTLQQRADTAYEQNAPSPEKEAVMEGAAEARRMLSKMPGGGEYGARNAATSTLISAVDSAEQAVNANWKSKIISPSTALAGMAGLAAGTIGNTTEAIVATLAAKYALQPQYVSRVMLLANKFAQLPGTTAANAVRMALSAAESSDTPLQQGETTQLGTTPFTAPAPSATPIRR